MLLALLWAKNLSNPLPVSCFVAAYRVRVNLRNS